MHFGQQPLIPVGNQAGEQVAQNLAFPRLALEVDGLDVHAAPLRSGLYALPLTLCPTVPALRRRRWHGTSVVFMLRAAAAGAAPGETTAHGEVPPMTPGRLLIAEDDESLRALLVRYFTSLGHSV